LALLVCSPLLLFRYACVSSMLALGVCLHI
jgi:hypothetical protein